MIQGLDQRRRGVLVGLADHARGMVVWPLSSYSGNMGPGTRYRCQLGNGMPTLNCCDRETQTRLRHLAQDGGRWQPAHACERPDLSGSPRARRVADFWRWNQFSLQSLSCRQW